MQLPGAYLSEFFFSVFLFLVVSVSWTFHALSCSLGTYCAHLAKKLQNRLILCQVSFSHLSSLCVNVSFLGYLILSLGRLNSMLYALKEPSEPSLCHTVLWQSLIVWYCTSLMLSSGEGNGTPLQHSCLENPLDGGAWWAAVHGVTKSQTRLSDFTFTFHFHALEEEMATHSSVLAWRIPGTGEPGGLPSMGSHRVRHGWSDLAAAAMLSSLWDCELRKSTVFISGVLENVLYVDLDKSLKNSLSCTSKISTLYSVQVMLQ